MMPPTLQDVADDRVLYLTTTGRKTGVLREIEIWFVFSAGRFYLFAETGEAANWVKNVRCNPHVAVRLSGQQLSATARILDRETYNQLRGRVAALAEQKYGWGDGLPVELTPWK